MRVLVKRSLVGRHEEVTEIFLKWSLYFHLRRFVDTILILHVIVEEL